MITVRTTKTARESVEDGNATIKSSDKSLLTTFVNEYSKYSIETLKAGTYEAIFSRITFDDGIPVFKVFDRFNDGDDFYEDDVWRINLTVANDIPAVKGRNTAGIEEYWVPCEGGWAWINFMPSRYEVKELTKKLSKEGQEEVKNGRRILFDKFGPYGERIVIKKLLSFEKYITNGKYFNGASILSDTTFIKNAFNGVVNDSTSEYPNLTMTMIGWSVEYQLLELYHNGYSDFLQFTFDVDCVDSNGGAFPAELRGRIYVDSPEEGFAYDYLERL